MWQTAKLSHPPGAFRPVPQSCTAGTLLRRKTETPAGHATLTLTYIIKQALNKYSILQTQNVPKVCQFATF